MVLPLCVFIILSREERDISLWMTLLFSMQGDVCPQGGLCGSTSPSRIWNLTLSLSSYSLASTFSSSAQFSEPKKHLQTNKQKKTACSHGLFITSHYLVIPWVILLFSSKICRKMGCCIILFVLWLLPRTACMRVLYKMIVWVSTRGAGLEVLLMPLSRANSELWGQRRKVEKVLGVVKEISLVHLGRIWTS